MHHRKFKRSSKTLEMVNLIPMINLIFLLLIFFLLTGVISKKDPNDISRPESEFGNEVEIDNQGIVFAINKNNEILYENKKVKMYLRKIKNRFLTKSIQILNKNPRINKFFTKIADRGTLI